MVYRLVILFFKFLLSTVKSFIITARVYNALSSEEDTIRIFTQYPITSVVLTSNSPINFEIQNTVEFSLEFLDANIPKFIEYFMEFGDGSSGELRKKNKLWSERFITHFFTSN